MELLTFGNESGDAMKHGDIPADKKRELYKSGAWYAQLKYVPGHDGEWSDQSWINFIYAFGRWKIDGKWTELHTNGKPESWWNELRESSGPAWPPHKNKNQEQR